MKKRIPVFFFFFIFFIAIAHGQEICNNGLDDDGDGLIDLNDTADCKCNGFSGSTVIPSLIPNPSFEQRVCCPTTYSMLTCASGWVQASMSTTDYLNHCGFVGGAVPAAGLNTFPDGDGIVGAIFLPYWKEYVGACLLQPMTAGKSYTIRFSIASTPVDGQGGVCNGGNIYFGPVNVTLFGSTSCVNMPFAGTACPAAPAWRILGTANYTPVASWGIITITFTPSVNINAIIIGSPCTLPAGYDAGPNGNCSPYFYYDNLILNTTSSFDPVTIDDDGYFCRNDVEIHSHTDTTGGSWQWYLDGIALPGQTDSTLYVSANQLGAGVYTSMYSLGPNCQLVNDTIETHLPEVDILSHTDVSCSGYNDGSATATVSGGSGILNCVWNTTPVQYGTIASNLPAGNYTISVTDTIGCMTNDSVTISTSHLGYNVLNARSICNGQSYTINSHTYTSTGTYYDTLLSVNGCDSVIITNLTSHSSYAINNSQAICLGETYSINSHNYSTPGIYYDTLSSISGCDSVIVTNLTAAQSYVINNPNTICSDQSYTINSHSYSVSGLYIDTLPTINGCDSIIITQLTVTPTFKVDNLQSICDGQSYSFNSHSYTLEGTYYDTLSSLSGCDSIVVTRIAKKQLPLITFSQLDDICIDAPPVTLHGGNPPGGIYSGTNVSNNIFYPYHSLEGIHPITYSYTDPLTNCTNKMERHITVYPLPQVEFTINPKVTFLANSKISFIDYTNGGSKWYWDFGDNTNSDFKYGAHIYNDTGYYQVSLIVTDNHGCINSSSDMVYIGLEFVFNVPNAFTPNGDGKNETFIGVGIGIGKYKMSIFDRWGAEIFKTNDINKPWKGENAQGGTYVYKINLEDITGTPYEYIGKVSVVR